VDGQQVTGSRCPLVIARDVPDMKGLLEGMFLRMTDVYRYGAVT